MTLWVDSVLGTTRSPYVRSPKPISAAPASPSDSSSSRYCGSVQARATIRAPLTGEALVYSPVRNSSISSSLASPAAIRRSSSRRVRAAAGRSSCPVKIGLPQVDDHGVVAAPPQVGGGEADRVAGLDPRRVDAAGTVIGQRPLVDGGEDHSRVPAHVPGHPGVVVRVPGLHPDPGARLVAHGSTPFSWT